MLCFFFLLFFLRELLVLINCVALNHSMVQKTGQGSPVWMMLKSSCGRLGTTVASIDIQDKSWPIKTPCLCRH